MTTPIKIGIIGGTGLGEALSLEDGQAIEVDTPFGPPSGPIMQTQWEGVDIAILHRHGPGHVFNPSTVPYRANIYALKSLGVTHIIASGATGSLVEHVRPGDVVIADQIIDKTHKRPNTFYDHAAVHVELAQPFCPVMRQWLLDAARQRFGFYEPVGRDDPAYRHRRHRGDETLVHDGGTYVCMEGPAFSTRAESLMHQSWGGQLIGMTVMPEARLAREAEIAYALIALPTDYDCWRPHDPNVGAQALLSEIIGNLNRATAAGHELIKLALQDISALQLTPSPAHSALKLAIWSNKGMIRRDEVERLAVLWGKYFD